MHLPSAWVDALFAKLSLRYGAAFMRQWPDADLTLVKADWAEVLGGFHARPDAIRYGLDNLDPSRPPNALQFRALCNAMPRDDAVHALPAPKVDKDSPVVKAAVAKLVDTRRSFSPNDPKAWAWKLREREQRSPVGMTLAQKSMWRTALPGVDLHDAPMEQAA